jgi:ribosomal-protein-alanine N-acetyltransferase
MSIDAAFVSFPSLNTDQLNLREIQSTDEEAFFSLKSDFEVTSSYGQEPHRSLEDTESWIQRLHGSYASRQAIVWCLTLKGQDLAIGACTFWKLRCRIPLRRNRLCAGANRT